MPGFLKSIFKPSPPKRHARPSYGGPLPPDVEFSPVTTPRELADADMEAIASRLRSHLVARTGDGGKDNDRTMSRLLDMLEESRVTPYRNTKSQGTTLEAATTERKVRKSKGRSRQSQSGQLRGAMRACDECLERAQRLLKAHAGDQSSNSDLLHRIVLLLDAQRAELGDMRSFTKDRDLPTLGTLRDIYAKIDSGLGKLSSLRKPKESRDKLVSFVQVLSEGPDYLIDIALVEAIIWYAEVIDPSYGAEIRKVLDRAIAEQGTLTTFRHAAETIIILSSSLPAGAVDDVESKTASKAINTLLRQLQTRVATSVANSTVPSPVASAPASPADSRSSSPPSSHEPEYQSLGASELEKRFGTGPMPTPRPSAPPTPRRVSEVESVEPEPEVWEYRGNLLTRSALDLVLRQERLAMADSSGQYAGEVSWDDLRNAWIPRWAEKLKPEDLADGELPNTNPAEFVEKKKDAWGNKIGWRDGRMYYHEEPKFILRD